MNFWIFVHTGKGEIAEKNFIRLLSSKSWGFKSSPQIRNKVKMLVNGDAIIFYIGGPNNKYFAGEAKLTSMPHAPKREAIGGPAELDFMVEFDEISLWERLYLTENVREKLDFITNKHNWGMSFGQSLVRITEFDYNNIKKLIRYE